MHKVKKPKHTAPGMYRGPVVKPNPAALTGIGLFLDDERSYKHVGFCADQSFVDWKTMRGESDAREFIEACIRDRVKLDAISLDIYLGHYVGGDVAGITFFDWFANRMRELYESDPDHWLPVDDMTLINVHSQSEYVHNLRRKVAEFERWLWRDAQEGGKA